VLRAKSEPPARKRSLSERSVAVKRTILQGFRIKKQHSAGDINQRVVKQSGAQESTPSECDATDPTAQLSLFATLSSFPLCLHELLSPLPSNTHMRVAIGVVMDDI